MRLTRVQRGASAAVVASVLTFGLVAGNAQAEPKDKVTPADVERIFHEAEALNEQVNQLGVDIKRTKSEISDLSQDLAVQRAEYERQKAELGQAIVQQQLDQPLGPTVSLLGSGNTEDFLAGLGAVQALNTTRADALEQFEATADELQARKDQLKKRQKSLKADNVDIEKKREKIRTKYREAKNELARLTAAEQAAFNASDLDLGFEVEASGKARVALNFAIAQLGDPYVWGGTGPNGWDCSGLVMMAYRAAGVSLPRVVGPQYGAVRHIPMSQLQPGDLVFYSDMSHDGIYVGKGVVIHAPRPGKSVEYTGIGPYDLAGRVG